MHLNSEHTPSNSSYSFGISMAASLPAVQSDIFDQLRDYIKRVKKLDAIYHSSQKKRGKRIDRGSVGEFVFRPLSSELHNGFPKFFHQSDYSNIIP